MKLASVLLLLWFLAALVLSVSDWFARFSSGGLFAVGAVAIAVGFTVLHSRSEQFRRFLRARSLKVITLGQVLRYYGLLAFFKSDQHVLPPLFAIPTGVLDAAFATTSFFVAVFLVSAKGKTKPGFIAWHIFGLMSLGTSVILAILTSSNRFGFVSNGITSQAMTRFPMSLVPTFIGPLMAVLHLQAVAAATAANSPRK